MILFSEIRMHRQTEDPVCGVFADGKRARRITQEREGRLQVQGLGVVDRRRNFILLKSLFQGRPVIAIFRKDGVLCPDAFVTCGDERSAEC